jgi:hypothetical protein
MREHSCWNIPQLCGLVNRILLKYYQLASPLTTGFVRVTLCSYVKVCLCDALLLCEGASVWRCVLMAGCICVTLRSYDRARVFDAVILWQGTSVWHCDLMAGCVCVTLCSYDRARLCEAMLLPRAPVWFCTFAEDASSDDVYVIAQNKFAYRYTVYRNLVLE